MFPDGEHSGLITKNQKGVFHIMVNFLSPSDSFVAALLLFFGTWNIEWIRFGWPYASMHPLQKVKSTKRYPFCDFVKQVALLEKSIESISIPRVKSEFKNSL